MFYFLKYLDTCIKLPGAEEKPGILPLEIRKLVDSRRQVKQLMQDKNLSIDLRMQVSLICKSKLLIYFLNKTNNFIIFSSMTLDKKP